MNFAEALARYTTVVINRNNEEDILTAQADVVAAVEAMLPAPTPVVTPVEAPAPAPAPAEPPQGT